MWYVYQSLPSIGNLHADFLQTHETKQVSRALISSKSMFEKKKNKK